MGPGYRLQHSSERLYKIQRAYDEILAINERVQKTKAEILEVGARERSRIQ
tara:strand:+ start:5850 stop:6002 length:153 start_codon:yes stop_codon:yes gene_type:complete